MSEAGKALQVHRAMRLQLVDSVHYGKAPRLSVNLCRRLAPIIHAKATIGRGRTGGSGAISEPDTLATLMIRRILAFRDPVWMPRGVVWRC